jgi:hypothetical protein
VPPERTTRFISATPFAGSGTKKITSAMVGRSKVLSANGSAMASPSRNSGTLTVWRWRAKASWPGDGSTPCTPLGARRSTKSSVKAPLPQPTSMQRNPFDKLSQSRKTSPAKRLQTPIMFS